jgi:glutathione S-transferase
MLAFYYAPTSCSTASHIALQESGLSYSRHRVRIYKPEEHANFKRDVNPLGTVPALHTEFGLLTENLAIMFYLARLRPELKLFPEDAFKWARCLSFMSWVGSSVQIARRQFRAPVRFTDDEAAYSGLSQSGAEKFKVCVAQINQRLVGEDWIMGDQYSLADGYALVVYHWAVLDKLDMLEYPHFTEHLRKMLKRAAVQEVLDAEKCCLLDYL